MSAGWFAGTAPRGVSRCVIWVIIILAASGCASPSAVKRFATASASAGKSFSVISDDLPESCVRRERYHYLGSWRSDLDSLEEATREPCDRYKRAAARLAGAHRVLASYLDSLGKLSAGDLVEYERSAGGLGEALAGIDPVEKEAIDAVTSISAALVEATAGKWRRKELGEVIARTNSDVQKLATALRAVIEEDYARLLDGESEAARKFYLGLINEHREAEPLSAVLLYEKWRDEMEAIDGKRQAARSYVKLLARIAAGHQHLYDHRSDLSSKELKALVLKHAEAVEDLAADLRRFI